MELRDKEKLIKKKKEYEKPEIVYLPDGSRYIQDKDKQGFTLQEAPANKLVIYREENNMQNENMILIDNEEYKKLIRESEQLNIIKNYLLEKDYIASSDVRIICNLPKKEGEQ